MELAGSNPAPPTREIACPVELTRAETVRTDPLRASIGGLSPGDLVEAACAMFFLGEPLLASLGMLDHTPRRFESG